MSLKFKDDNGNELPQNVQDRVNAFIEKLPTIPWFKPSKELKKEEVEKQAKFTLECFGIKASVEYRTIKSETDWDSARASAWASAWDSAWDSARDSAWDSARASARDSAWDSAWASIEVLLDDNEDFKKKYPNGAFIQLFKLWEM